MKARSAQFIISSCLMVALAGLPWHYLLCCGPSLAPDEDRFALFRQALINDNPLKGFAYTEASFDFDDVDPDQLDNNRNCKEWKTFTATASPLTQIYQIQYNTNPDVFLHAFKTNDWKEFSGNKFIEWLTRKQNKAALNYMALAKQVEATQYSTLDAWDTANTASLYRCYQLALQSESGANTTASTFLKERYAFQAIKMYMYSSVRGSKNKSSFLYNKYLKNSNSIVGGWVLAYMAKMEPDEIQQTRYLLKVFDETEEKKMFAYYLLTKAGLEAVSRQPSSAHEKALAGTLLALKNPGRALTQIKAVFKAEPSCRYLPLLLTREVNKLEHWLWTFDYLGFDKFGVWYTPKGYDNVAQKLTRKKDRQYLLEVLAFTRSVTTARHQWIAKLIQVHLLNIAGDYASAATVLNSIPAQGNTSFKIQKLVEEFIISINTQDISLPQTKAQLAAILGKLMALQPAMKKQLITEDDFYSEKRFDESSDDISELLLMLSKRYEAKGNVVTAGLLYNKANVIKNQYNGWRYEEGAGYYNIAYFDRHAAPADMDSLLTFKHKLHKTSFEKLLAPQHWGPDDQYKDLKGTILYRQKKYREALAVFSGMQPGYWMKYYEFASYLPNTSVTHTGRLIPSENTKPKLYPLKSKKLIVQDVVNTQDAISRATSSETKAAEYYKLANAYFNTSYWGKAWMLFSYGNSDNEYGDYDESAWNWAWFRFYPNGERYGDYYYLLKDALDAYNKAYTLSGNAELKAKCLVAMATCSGYAETYMQSKKKLKHAKANTTDYLGLLLKNFSHTRAFTSAAVECPDVREYVEQHKK